MKVVFLRSDGNGMRKVKEFQVKEELNIKLPDIGEIKVRKLMPTIEINDEYIVTKKYSIRLGDKIITGGKYEVLRALLDKKAKNIDTSIVDTLYYDTPSQASVITEVYDDNKLINIISYNKEKDDTLRITIKFMRGHFVSDMWVYEIINTKHKKTKM